MQLDLSNLEAIAKSATQGEWFFCYASIFAVDKTRSDEKFWDSVLADESNNHTYENTPCADCGDAVRCHKISEALDADCVVASVAPSFGDTATGQRALDATHIATFNPPTVLALIERIRELEGLISEIQRDNANEQ